jgi:hypothetical protein
LLIFLVTHLKNLIYKRTSRSTNFPTRKPAFLTSISTTQLSDFIKNHIFYQWLLLYVSTITSKWYTQWFAVSTHASLTLAFLDGYHMVSASCFFSRYTPSQARPLTQLIASKRATQL